MNIRFIVLAGGVMVLSFIGLVFYMVNSSVLISPVPDDIPIKIIFLTPTEKPLLPITTTAPTPKASS